MSLNLFLGQALTLLSVETYCVAQMRNKHGDSGRNGLNEKTVLIRNTLPGCNSFATAPSVLVGTFEKMQC